MSSHANFHPLESRILFSLPSDSPALLGDWTAAEGSVARTSYFPGSVNNSVPVKIWSDTSIFLGSFPIVADGRIYFSKAHTFTALDAATGAFLWETEYNSGFFGNASFYNSTLYLVQNGSEDGKLFALDATNGSTLFTQPLTPKYTSIPAPAANNLGIWLASGEFSGNNLGFNLDGTSITTSAPGQTFVPTTPTLSSDAIYTASVTGADVGKLYKLAPNGSVIWSASVNAPNLGVYFLAPSVDNPRVYLQTTTQLFAYDTTTGAELWHTNTPAPISTTSLFTPAIQGNQVFVVSGNTLLSYAADTGTPGISYNLPQGEILASPIITDDAVLLSTTAGTTLIFDRTSAQLRSTINAAGILTLADNRLFITSTAGGVAIHAFEFRTALHAQLILPSQTYAEGSNISLNNSVSREVASYEWDFDYDGTTFTSDAAGATPTLTAPNGPATRTIALRVTTADGVTDLTTSTLTITNTPPTASTTFTPTSRTFTLTGADVPADTLTYALDFDNDGIFDLETTNISADLPIAFIRTGPTERTLRLKVTDNDGASSESTLDYSIASIDRTPKATGPITAEPTLPYTLTLDASLTTLTSWTITWGDGTTETLPADATTATHIFPLSGTYSVTATATDSPQPSPVPISVQVAPAPDLAISLPTLPATAIPGKLTKTSLTLTNLGTGLASTKATLRLRASTDLTLSEDDTTLATLSTTVKLKPGQSKPFSLKTLFPDALDQLSAYVYADLVLPETFSERTLTNNTTGVSATTAINKYFVDLTPTAKLSGRSPFTPGSIVKVSASLLNLGTVSASGNSELYATLFRGSPDNLSNAVFIDGDSQFFEDLTLRPKGKKTASFSFTLPANIQAGTYFIRLYANYYGQDSDLTTTNNAFFTPTFQVTR